MSFKCKVSGCNADKHKAKGLCAFHYERFLKGTPLNQRKRTKAKGAVCSVDGCDKVVSARGFCSKHHQRWRKHGDPNTTKIGIEYGSGKDWRVGRSGYVYRYDHELRKKYPKKRGLVYQHRQVMEECIGRELMRDENVHHKNGVRSDNRIENLELWSKGQPAGQRIQDKMDWCADFLLEHISNGLALGVNMEKMRELAKTLQDQLNDV